VASLSTLQSFVGADGENILRAIASPFPCAQESLEWKRVKLSWKSSIYFKRKDIIVWFGYKVLKGW
jgi:hypothetical protein